MKKTLHKGLMLSVLALMSSNVFAVSSGLVFQWTGTVPVAYENEGICIVPVKGSGNVLSHDSGLISFHNKKVKGVDSAPLITHDVHSSSELAFTVTELVGEDCSSEQMSPYSYQLTQLKVAINGSELTEQVISAPNQKGHWQIKHSKAGEMGQLLTDQKSEDVAEGTVVGLKVDGHHLPISAGDSVLVQAFVLVHKSNSPL